MLVMLAAAAGIAVANLYYLQPLLAVIAHDFHASARDVGLVSVMAQAGYAIGIIAFVPLGDVLQPRRLLGAMFLAVAVMLGCAASATNVAVLGLATLAVGICTTCAQVLLPFAVEFAAPSQRGRVVGMMQTGLIVGTLSARVVGGIAGAHFGWRSVFWGAAALSGACAFALSRATPLRASRPAMRYRDLLASIPPLVVRHPALRAAMGTGLLSFGTFAGVWTVLAFHMHDLGYGADTVGLTGALALVSAVGAGRFGVVADRRGTLFTATLGWIALLATFASFALFGWSIWGVLAGSTLMPLGISLTQISNQTRIFALDAAGRSRINTAYMFALFLGGALGALGAALAWQSGGWTAVCVFELICVVAMGPLLLFLRALDARETLAA
ncbi:MAG: MFS transporter [Candidatus Elarobacter sp.]